MLHVRHALKTIEVHVSHVPKTIVLHVRYALNTIALHVRHAREITAFSVYMATQENNDKPLFSIFISTPGAYCSPVEAYFANTV